MPRYHKHFVVPDVQAKPGVPLEHMRWAGKYAASKQPDHVILLGDVYDMESLCEYDRSTRTRSFYGRAYQADLAAGDKAVEMFTNELLKPHGYHPQLTYLIGNHEERYCRLVGADPRLEGSIRAPEQFARTLGWKVHDFLETTTIDGVAYAHYFCRSANGTVMNSKAGAPSARAQIMREMCSATAGHKQGLDVAILPTPRGLVRGIIAGCLTPDHKVLTADLRYIPVGELKAGDKVVSFDEQPRRIGGRSKRRRFITGTVEAIVPDEAEIFAVQFASGKVFKVTRDHQWLVKTGSKYYWKTTDTLRGGTRVPRLLGEWNAGTSYEAGWLAGMYDGEGSLYSRETTGGRVLQLAVSQKPGPILDKLHALLRSVLNVRTNDSRASTAYQLRIKGSAPEIARVLGVLRPARLLGKFVPEMLGSIVTRPGDLDTVVSVARVGRGIIMRSQIDTGTYVVEGYAHHNSFYQHDEDFLTPQGRYYWRGVLLKHEVHNGNYNLLEVSLDFLKRKFG